MAKGTRTITFRCPDKLWESATRAVLTRNDHSRDEPWELSDFIRIAMAEKLAKMERSRGKKARVQPGNMSAWKRGSDGALQMPGQKDNLTSHLYPPDDYEELVHRGVFRIGDRVICIDDADGAHFLENGKEYTIQSLCMDREGEVGVNLVGMARVWEITRFVLSEHCD